MKTTRRGFFGLIGAAIAAKPAAKAAAKIAYDFATESVRVNNGPALTIESLTHAFATMQAQAERVMFEPTTLLVPPELYQTARAILDENSAPARPGDCAFVASPYVQKSYRLNGPDWFKVTRAG